MPRFGPYVSVADRRKLAARAMEKLRKKGHVPAPIAIEGRDIAQTFWGRAWCDNLEAYSDFASRLPRGRTYVRNGSVVDLQISVGEIRAVVSGSELYEVTINVAAVPKARWNAICKDSAGAIDSLVELLQGRLSMGVMERLCRQRSGLFPAPDEIELDCSCPDHATMCKHVAAVLYGIGARLDEQPELLFRLREVDHQQLIARADQGIVLATSGKRKTGKSRIMQGADLSALFGLDLGAPVAPAPAPKRKRRS